MPIESLDFIRLLGGVILLIIPGYLWSFIFSKKFSNTERIIFGFLISIAFFTSSLFLLNAVFGIPLSYQTLVLLYAIITIPVAILYVLSIYRYGPPSIGIQKILKNKKMMLLIFILLLSFFMTLLPHLVNGYYLPFHVDEWEHLTYTREVMETQSVVFPNPYTGNPGNPHPEIGFHIASACIAWLSGASLVTIFVFMASIIGVLLSISAYNIGEKNNTKFGLEAAFLIAFIPTTVRFLGPSFFVALSFGLLILLFLLWLATTKEVQIILLIAPLMWSLIFIHPPTALAGVIILLSYAFFLAVERQNLTALTVSLFTVAPVLIIYYLTTRWSIAIQILMQAIYGKEYLNRLSEIWINFEHLGFIIWVLFIIGAYFSFAKGKALVRSLSLSSIIAISIIGVYTEFDYGLPILYDRSFMYLFLIVTLLAGYGLKTLQDTIKRLKIKNMQKRVQHLISHTKTAFPFFIAILIIATVVPVHMSIPYYELINEKQYADFVWIDHHIQSYQNETHPYDKAIVDPLYASPFSAITGLNTAASRMSPLFFENRVPTIQAFFNKKCEDTQILHRYRCSVIYADSCNNSNFTKIYENVYLYPGLFK